MKGRGFFLEAANTNIWTVGQTDRQAVLEATKHELSHRQTNHARRSANRRGGNKA